MDKRFEWRTDAYGKERRCLYMCGLYVGCIIPTTAAEVPFRAWLMTDDEGDRIGVDQWPTEDAARAAVEIAALAVVGAFEETKSTTKGEVA